MLSQLSCDVNMRSEVIVKADFHSKVLISLSDLCCCGLLHPFQSKNLLKHSHLFKTSSALVNHSKHRAHGLPQHPGYTLTLIILPHFIISPSLRPILILTSLVIPFHPSFVFSTFIFFMLKSTTQNYNQLQKNFSCTIIKLGLF